MSESGKMKLISRRQTIMFQACIYFMFLLISSGCIEKMELPSEINTDDIEFSAGDTTYLLLSPVWDESYGFQAPIEISIAQDGHVFIADSGANSIFVLKQDGSILPDFQDLRNITVDDTTISPIDVDIDQKMNVFFIDGSQKIYCWNQYWNDVGIDSLLIDSEWKKMDVLIDSLLAVHVFFDGENPAHNFSDQWFETEESKFSGLSEPGDNSDFIYVTDAYHNRIIRIDFFKTYYIKLSTGEEVWAHEGHFGETVTEYGTGAGFVNQPLSIDVDYEGNIFYTQSGQFFDIHQIQPKTEGDYSIYPFAVEWEGNDIMDTARFHFPEDISVDKNRMVYVADSSNQEIQVFNSDGSFFKKAGVDYINVDTSYIGLTLKDTSWTEFFVFFEVKDENDSIIYIVEDTTIIIYHTLIDTSIIDTSYTKEIKMLEQPRAVTVDSRGVIYICDTPTSSILRFRLSNQLDENLNPVP